MIMSPKPHTKIHAKPRITANELAKFMVAGDVGRKGIIKRAREASTSIVIRYSDARQALRAALCDLVNEKKIIISARESFEQRAHDSSLSDWSRDDALKSIDVMDAFQGMRNQMVGFDFTMPPPDQPYLTIGGVSVSVNCDILIHGIVKGAAVSGGGLFRLTKPDEQESDAAKAKRKEMGIYAATLVFMHSEKNLTFENPVKPELCWSVDVQNSEIHEANRNYKTRANNLEAACGFIAAMWDKV